MNLAIVNLPEMTLIGALVALTGGAIGALAKDCIVDGALCLPYKKDGKLYVGFIGGMLVGAFVGMVVDGSFGTALLGGYVGTSVIDNLLYGHRFPRKQTTSNNISDSEKL